ncbi:peptidase [Pannus brasiliensis CCIBt3594]|uniref:Peptidase n=1 Tax=Pannus brasiliensis CCIBt3594 TaxID=1427578 RepID=A0AAW9QMX9_9CHRO
MRAFRKYHRVLAIALCLPLFLTVISGMGFTIVDEWFKQEELAEFLLKVHTFDILGLETIYPVLNGLGLLGLLITGISMTGLWKKRRES